MASAPNHLLASSIAAVVFDRSGRHLTAYVSGELDAASAPGIVAQVASHLDPSDERIWLDMSATSFCDSTGVLALFDLHRQVDANGGRLVVYSPTDQVRRVLEICDHEHHIAVRT